MRVLALTNLYPNPFQPTRATFNRQQFAILARKHDVRVIAPIAWIDELRARRNGKSALPSDRRITNDGLIVDHPRYLYPPKMGRRWYGRCFQLSTAKTFDRVVAEFSPDVVFAPWAYPDGWAAVQLAKRYRLPVVVKCHGSDVLLLDKHPSRRKPTIEAVRSADGVCAVSRHIAKRLIEMDVKPERLRVVVDGVDQDKFKPGSKSDARSRLGTHCDHPIILFVGNLVAVKGVDLLLKACAELKRSGVAYRLVVIGDGPLRGILDRLATAFNIQESVHFLGVVKHEELPDWFRAADLFVLPSRSEGIPSVLLEASACDTPWIATSVGGIPEIAELGRSLLVQPESPDALSQGIREMLAAAPTRPTRQTKSSAESVAELADLLNYAVETALVCS